ncbi:FG-GAP-like repeat-containing protein [Hymenobacter saemangeumensis]|uniref:FG-GAP-like repeat-containing protein n=1 Tax=Hymenobacter saemangeumensis TaxID=1084522 RepID=A0ABP8HWP5_9BACT
MHQTRLFARSFGLVLFTVALQALLPVPARAQDFGPIAVYNTNNNLGSGYTGPNEVQLGDVNGDGLPDIVTTDIQDGVGVMLALAGGGFGPYTTYAVGPGTNSGALKVALGDVTGDGRPDIVASTYYGLPSVGVLPALSGGGFGPYTTLPVMFNVTVRGLALGDMNGDGRLDVVSTSLFDNAVDVFMAQPGGVFAAPLRYTTGPGSSPEGLALGDVNGDGRLDIATTTASNNGGAALLLALSTGGFGPPTTYLFAGQPRNVALGDVSGDGRLDLVVAGQGAAQVGVLLGQAGGGFGAATAYPCGGGGLGMTLGDVDNDGLLDVVVANTNTTQLGILPGRLGGILGPLAVYSTNHTATYNNERPYAVAVGDVNNDGRPDLVAALAMVNEVVVLLAVNPVPTVTGMLPAVGSVGSRMTLTGADLTGTQLIRFTGSNATVSSGFRVNAAGTSISDIVVPAGALTGPITVQKASGAATTAGYFSVQNPTSTSAATLAQALHLLPNPAHAATTVALAPMPGATHATLTLRDALGRTVSRETVALPATGLRHELRLLGLAAGLYALQVQAGEIQATRRLVVE